MAGHATKRDIAVERGYDIASIRLLLKTSRQREQGIPDAVDDGMSGDMQCEDGDSEVMMASFKDE